MPMTNTPVFAQTPLVGIATLTSPTAVTSRANITGTTGLTQLTATSTNGIKLDNITVKGKGTSSAAYVFIWIYNGTTSYLFDEISISAITGSTTVSSVRATKDYTLQLPPTYQLYVSVSVAQDLNIFASSGAY